MGLIGWIQSNKRWDICSPACGRRSPPRSNSGTGQTWDLLAAGAMRDPNHAPDYERYAARWSCWAKGWPTTTSSSRAATSTTRLMAICDFIVLPTTDETQSGTLARIIALNKPYITTAPMEGLTAQTLESGGGLLFTTKEMLRGTSSNWRATSRCASARREPQDVPGQGGLLGRGGQPVQRGLRPGPRAKQSGNPVELEMEF